MRGPSPSHAMERFDFDPGDVGPNRYVLSGISAQGRRPS